jgi:hypothetical protein
MRTLAVILLASHIDGWTLWKKARAAGADTYNGIVQQQKLAALEAADAAAADGEYRASYCIPEKIAILRGSTQVRDDVTRALSSVSGLSVTTTFNPTCIRMDWMHF